MAGFVGAPGWSVYSATKAAVAAFSEVIALDVKEFGIKVTIVEPSGFRTGFLSPNSIALITSKIKGYEAVKKTHRTVTCLQTESRLATQTAQPKYLWI